MAGGNPALMLSERNFEKYYGKWVAVQSWHRINQILASGNDLDILKEKMKNKSYFNAVIFFVEDERAPV